MRESGQTFMEIDMGNANSFPWVVNGRGLLNGCVWLGAFMACGRKRETEANGEWFGTRAFHILIPDPTRE